MGDFHVIWMLNPNVCSVFFLDLRHDGGVNVPFTDGHRGRMHGGLCLARAVVGFRLGGCPSRCEDAATERAQWSPRPRPVSSGLTLSGGATTSSPALRCAETVWTRLSTTPLSPPSTRDHGLDGATTTRNLAP